MLKKSTVCPSCKNVGKLHKSHSKNIFEKIINHSFVFGTFRCHNCGWRGVLFRKNSLNLSFLNLLKAFFLFAIVYFIVLYLIKNYTN
jgi:rubredoxin